MRHENSVFHQIQKQVPWAVFSKLVDKYRANHRSRRLTAKQHFLALLFGQLAGSVSLRDLEAGLMSQSARLYHAGGRCVARTTLADANARRPAALFADLFAHMAAGASRATRRHIKDAVRILDATRLDVGALCGGWADMVAGHRAVKLHITYDPLADAPVEAGITGQRVNDVVVAKTLTPVPGVTYVFDLGYYDYGWWARLDSAGCRFVSRLKCNTQIQVLEVRPRPQDSAILADHVGLLPKRMARSRQNPLSTPVRELTVRISTGKIIRVVTNDLESPAEEIADLYKQRWQIELFFKWIKQNLKIRHFIGRSKNAISIQIFVALIAFLLLRGIQVTKTNQRPLLTFTRLIRLNIMHRRPVDTLQRPKAPPILDQRQLTLNFSPT